MLAVALASFVVAAAMVFGAAWGAGENRLWKEAGEAVQQSREWGKFRC